jgi:hypothetical protein
MEFDELLRDAITAVYWFDRPMFVRAVQCLAACSRARGLEALADICLQSERSVRGGSPVPLGQYLAVITKAYRAARLSLSTRSRQEDN